MHFLYEFFALPQIQNLYLPPFNSLLQKAAITSKKLLNSPFSKQVFVVSQIQILYLRHFNSKAAVSSKKSVGPKISFVASQIHIFYLSSTPHFKKPPFRQRSHSKLHPYFRFSQHPKLKYLLLLRYKSSLEKAAITKKLFKSPI